MLLGYILEHVLARILERIVEHILEYLLKYIVEHTGSSLLHPCMLVALHLIQLSCPSASQNFTT